MMVEYFSFHSFGSSKKSLLQLFFSSKALGYLFRGCLSICGIQFTKSHPCMKHWPYRGSASPAQTQSFKTGIPSFWAVRFLRFILERWIILGEKGRLWLLPTHQSHCQGLPQTLNPSTHLVSHPFSAPPPLHPKLSSVPPNYPSRCQLWPPGIVFLPSSPSCSAWFTVASSPSQHPDMLPLSSPSLGRVVGRDSVEGGSDAVVFESPSWVKVTQKPCLARSQVLGSAVWGQGRTNRRIASPAGQQRQLRIGGGSTTNLLRSNFFR